MLVLSRKVNQSIVINGNIKIIVAGIQGGKVRLGIEAPQDVPVHRQEVATKADRDMTQDAVLTAKQIRQNSNFFDRSQT